MNTSPQKDDFSRLLRFLALKRHEQPPPGYFENFRRELMAELRAGAGARGVDEAVLLSDAPWLHWLWRVFQGKPILAGAFGVAVCSLVISGLYYSETHTAAPVVLGPVPEETVSRYAEKATPAPLFTGGAAELTLSSTGGVARMENVGSLFNGFPRPQAQPASLVVPR